MTNRELSRKINNMNIKFINIPNSFSENPCESEIMQKTEELENIIKIYNNIDYKKNENNDIDIIIDYEKIDDAINQTDNIERIIGYWHINK